MTDAQKEYRKKNRERIRVSAARYYAQNRDKAKARSRAHWWKNREANLLYDRERNNNPVRRAQKSALSKARYQLIKEDKKKYSREYHARNKERVKENHRRWVENNREHVNAKNRAWATNNKDKIRAWNNKWAKNNPHKTKANDHLQRALKFGSRTDKESVEQFFFWIANQDFVTCTYCGVFISGKSVHIDHIVPLARGGDHLPDNFAVACKSCNSSKHNLLLSEWPKCPDKFRRLYDAIGSLI